jgi:hypothetical protein
MARTSELPMVVDHLTAGTRSLGVEAELGQKRLDHVDVVLGLSRYSVNSSFRSSFEPHLTAVI